MKLSLRYDLPCTVERYWELYYDEDYTTRLHLEGLGSTSVEILEQSGDQQSGIRRVLRYGQRPDAPGPVKKLFGTEIFATEISNFDPATSSSTFTVTPGTLGDKTDIRGSIRMEPLPAGGRGGGADGEGGQGAGGGCRQYFEIEAKVKIFGAGPVVERFVERQARDTQEKAIAFLKRELAGG